MATDTVPRRAVAESVATILDSPEVASLIEELNAGPLDREARLRRTGSARSVHRQGALRDPSLDACRRPDRRSPRSVGGAGGTPSHWACYRFATKLRKHRAPLAACIDALAVSLREQFPEMGKDVAIDASDLPAWANGQRFLYNHGPERQAYSDPDASWGHRSAISTRKGGGFYGYKIQMAACTATGLPLAWRVETARHHESTFVAPLLDAVTARGFKPVTCAMDKGYDNGRIYAECAERGVPR